MPSIEELKEAVAHWEEVEKSGGSPSSSNKLHAAKEALKAAGGIEEPVIDDWNEDDAIAQADEEE